MDTNKDKIIVHRVQLGFDVNDEVRKEIDAKIDISEIKEAKDIIDSINNNPSLLKKEEDELLKKSLEEICQIVKDSGKINKNKILEISKLSNLTSAVGKLRNYMAKNHNKKLIKIGKDDYGWSAESEQPETVLPS